MWNKIDIIADRMMEELPLDSVVIVATFPDGNQTGYNCAGRGNIYASKAALEYAINECDEAINHTPTESDDDEEDFQVVPE